MTIQFENDLEMKKFASKIMFAGSGKYTYLCYIKVVFRRPSQVCIPHLDREAQANEMRCLLDNANIAYKWVSKW